jgi:hypothetical protein
MPNPTIYTQSLQKLISESLENARQYKHTQLEPIDLLQSLYNQEG